MLCTDPMPGSNDSTLQEAECAFDGVGVNLAVNVNAIFVSDSLMLRFELAHRRRVRPIFIGDDHFNIFGDVVFDECGQRSDAHVASVEESNVATSLSDSKDDLLFALRMAGFVLMPALSRADVRFVDFDGAIKGMFVYFVHRGTD